MNSWLNLYKFLCIFGDGQLHDYNEIHYHGYNIFNEKRLKWQDIFNKCLQCSLLYRERKTGIFERDAFALTEKGDRAFREWSIRVHEKENESYRYYKYFDRTPESFDKFAPQIKGINKEELNG